MYHALSGPALDKLPSILPSCWSADFDDCVHERPNSYPGCSDVLAAKKEDEAAYYKLTDAIPNCALCYEANQEKAQACFDAEKTKTFWFVVVAAAGALGGVALAALLT